VIPPSASAKSITAQGSSGSFEDLAHDMIDSPYYQVERHCMFHTIEHDGKQRTMRGQHGIRHCRSGYPARSFRLDRRRVDKRLECLWTTRATLGTHRADERAA